MKNNKFDLTNINMVINICTVCTSTAPHAYLLVLFNCEHTSTEVLTFKTSQEPGFIVTADPFLRIFRKLCHTNAGLC